MVRELVRQRFGHAARCARSSRRPPARPARGRAARSCASRGTASRPSPDLSPRAPKIETRSTLNRRSASQPNRNALYSATLFVVAGSGTSHVCPHGGAVLVEHRRPRPALGCLDSRRQSAVHTRRPRPQVQHPRSPRSRVSSGRLTSHSPMLAARSKRRSQRWRVVEAINTRCRYEQCGTPIRHRRGVIDQKLCALHLLVFSPRSAGNLMKIPGKRVARCLSLLLMLACCVVAPVCLRVRVEQSRS